MYFYQLFLLMIAALVAVPLILWSDFTWWVSLLLGFGSAFVGLFLLGPILDRVGTGQTRTDVTGDDAWEQRQHQQEAIRKSKPRILDSPRTTSIDDAPISELEWSGPDEEGYWRAYSEHAGFYIKRSDSGKYSIGYYWTTGPGTWWKRNLSSLDAAKKAAQECAMHVRHLRGAIPPSPLTYQAAEETVLKMLREYEANTEGLQLVIFKEQTLERPWGWVFFCGSQEFFDSGDLRCSIAGNAPIIINSSSGEVRVTGTAMPVEHYIDEYEEEIGLGRWTLFLNKMPEDRVAVLRVLRDELGLSLAEAGAVGRGAGPWLIASGTRYELKKARTALTAAGAEVGLSQRPP